MNSHRGIIAFSLILTSSVSAQDTAHVKSGWNMIGSVKAGAVPDVLSTFQDSLIISSYWGYNPGVGYESTDTLVNGTGYWVKAKEDGLIVFNNAPPIDSCKSKAFIYEGKLYHTVLIGEQCWMAENLDVGVMIDSLQDATNNDTTEKYCYNNDPLNCALYGGLYQWDEAMKYTATLGAEGVCPQGWHIPSLNEFQTLQSSVGWDGNSLKVVGQGSEGGLGTNTSGFSALLGGYNSIINFWDINTYNYYWSSSEYGPTSAYARYLSTYDGSFPTQVNSSKKYGFSVRCLED